METIFKIFIYYSNYKRKLGFGLSGNHSDLH